MSKFGKTMLRREGVRGSKKKSSLYQSPTCHGDTTFYGIAKSSFMTKIWPVKFRVHCSVPYKIRVLKLPKTALCDQYSQNWLSLSFQIFLKVDSIKASLDTKKQLLLKILFKNGRFWSFQPPIFCMGLSNSPELCRAIYSS